MKCGDFSANVINSTVFIEERIKIIMLLINFYYEIVQLMIKYLNSRNKNKRGHPHLASTIYKNVKKHILICGLETVFAYASLYMFKLFLHKWNHDIPNVLQLAF